MPDITIKGADGSFGAYMATPAAGKGPGLVVIQEIFGVNQVMRDTCDSYARQGFIAVCPDMFWRIQPGVQLTDKTEAEWGQAFELMQKFLPDFQKGVADIGATIAHVRAANGCNGKVGVVGFCLGGSLTYAASCFTDGDAFSGYYPVQIDDFLPASAGIKKPAIFHIAEKDQFCPPESQAKIKEALGKNPNCAVHVYPGVDHAFARIGGANYNKAAADQANARTLEVFRKALV